jgi:hypothetical protein
MDRQSEYASSGGSLLGRRVPARALGYGTLQEPGHTAPRWPRHGKFTSLERHAALSQERCKRGAQCHGTILVEKLDTNSSPKRIMRCLSSAFATFISVVFLGKARSIGVLRARGLWADSSPRHLSRPLGAIFRLSIPYLALRAAASRNVTTVVGLLRLEPEQPGR